MAACGRERHRGGARRAPVDERSGIHVPGGIDAVSVFPDSHQPQRRGQESLLVDRPFAGRPLRVDVGQEHLDERLRCAACPGLPALVNQQPVARIPVRLHRLEPAFRDAGQSGYLDEPAGPVHGGERHDDVTGPRRTGVGRRQGILIQCRRDGSGL